MWFEEFQDGRHGGHLGYWNRTILAILNLHNTPIPPLEFKLNHKEQTTPEPRLRMDSNKNYRCVCVCGGGGGGGARTGDGLRVLNQLIKCTTTQNRI